MRRKQGLDCQQDWRERLRAREVKEQVEQRLKDIELHPHGPAAAGPAPKQGGTVSPFATSSKLVTAAPQSPPLEEAAKEASFRAEHAAAITPVARREALATAAGKTDKRHQSLA